MNPASATWRRLIAVFCGGFCGTLARYLLSTFIQTHLGKDWPYDIFLINLTGALLLACITRLAEETTLIGPTRRLFLNIGFLGAYTTFSSLALGDVLLFNGGQWLPALLYLLLSMGGGVLATMSGDWLGLWLAGKVRRKVRTEIEKPDFLQEASQYKSQEVMQVSQGERSSQ